MDRSPEVARLGHSAPHLRSTAAVDSLLNCSSRPAALHDADGRVVGANDAFAMLLGTDAAALIDLGINDLVHPIDLSAARLVFDAARASHADGEPARIRLAHADGAWTRLDLVFDNLLDEPAIAGVLVTVTGSVDSASRRDRAVALAHGLAVGHLRVTFGRIVCLSRGLTHGAETIVRWRAPGRPERRRDDLAEVAAANGMISSLGASIVGRVASAITEVGQPASVTVNVPAFWLRDEHLVEMVSATLARHGVPGESIGFEINEAGAASDLEAASATFRHLRALGCEVGMAGYGTTVASTRLLHHLEPDYVKLPRTAVARLLDDPEALTGVSALLLAARERGIGTIAAGVERGEQASWLRDLGCELAEGPWWGLPESRLTQADAHVCRAS